MANSEWFRNTEWNDSIERAFFTKLARARRKAEYLRIQASILSQRHPNAALKLLEQYFSLGDPLFGAQAHLDRASAFLSLGNMAEALQSFEEALATEARRPNVLTEAYVRYPFAVAVHGIKDRYERVSQILEDHRRRLTFPVERFRWHAARALIAADLGQTVEAGDHARKALAQAAADHSGFRHHPNIGLVGTAFQDLRERLERMSR